MHLLAAQDGSAPENQRQYETWRTLLEPWTFRRTFWQPTDLLLRTRWNLGETLAEPCWNLGPSAEPFGSRRICSSEPDGTLVKPWRNLVGTLDLPQNLLAADGSAPENRWNLGETLAEPCWNLGPSAEPFGSRRICSSEPDGTLVKPWRNLVGTLDLPQNLLAAQDGSAPENQMEPW